MKQRILALVLISLSISANAADQAAIKATTETTQSDGKFKCGLIPSVDVSRVAPLLEAEVNKHCRAGKVPSISTMPGLLYYCCESK